MNIFVTVAMVLILWLLMTFFSWLWVIISAKSTGTILTSDQFSQKIEETHSAQIIDVRETSTYKRSHIMGARNIPSMNFSQGKSGLRKDRDIFLYDDSLRNVLRASKALKKQSYDKQHIFLLRGGFKNYPGKKTN
ncbi:rhodanese-like domain-containing protein [Leuconostoc palmae]|uniref:rhodanese-like domain-containing protein n=1 Tax=Leuconostoc palmae TaxID=501487 RepID=UPI001C7D41A6|nr:rhodanese-like domain-containing protein [Leuconostoc palmae]